MVGLFCVEFVVLTVLFATDELLVWLLNSEELLLELFGDD